MNQYESDLDIDQDKLAQIILELDDMIPRDGAAVQLESTPDHTDNFITANRLGFLRLGVEMLKAGYLPPASEIPDTPSPVGDVDLSYIFQSDVEVQNTDTPDAPQQFVPPNAPVSTTRTMDSASQIVLFILIFVLLMVAALIVYALGWFGHHG